ncbi:hypothetical protein TNCV_778221 [Trichonephila clavipes]|nr:hypothetical protein TNCV_778221 [Trichonephila clavipes]
MIGLTPEESLPLCFKSTGHIHVSQAPHRNEPSAAGWIDYTKVFTLLKEYNYKGTIGLNYRPSDPEQSFKWLQNNISPGTPKKGITSRLTGAGSLLPPVYSKTGAKGVDGFNGAPDLRRDLNLLSEHLGNSIEILLLALVKI